jgi:hypothetical protein
MKISYRTNPIIELLEKKDGGFRVKEADRNQFNTVSKDIMDFIDKKGKVLSENVSIVTDPFSEAFQKASIKLVEAMYQGKLVTIFETGVHILHKTTYLYSITEESFTLAVFEGDWLIAFIKSTNIITTNKTFLTANIPELEENMLATQLLLFLWFKKYCEIDVKFIGAGKKVKDVNCKYINDTKTNVTILDSSWFTTIVKSEGFAVRGHFRLQVCGKAMKERKLVWISDFEKHGYTRHFKRPATLEEFTF